MGVPQSPYLRGIGAIQLGASDYKGSPLDIKVKRLYHGCVTAI